MDANDTTLSTAGETGVMLIIVLTIELEELFFYELFPQVLHLDLVFTDTVSINDDKDSIYILL